MSDLDWDAEALRASLRPLAPEAPIVLTPGEDAYLRHYDIHFKEDFEDLTHFFGKLDHDPYELAVHLWRPEHAVGSAIVLHGYFDHVGLFGHLIRFLVERRLAVLSYDFPGHGLSSGPRASIESFDEYVAAFDACVKAFGAHLPAPWHLIGQSTGAAVAMEWLLANGLTRETSPFASTILLAPLVRPAKYLPGRFLYHVLRWFRTHQPRRFGVSSEDAEFLDFLRRRDPLQSKLLPLRWVAAMMQWTRRFHRHAPTDIAPVVIQGEQDKTVDWRHNVKVIEKLFEPEIHYIPEARHHLVNESAAVRVQVFDIIGRKLAGADAAKTKPAS